MLLQCEQCGFKDYQMLKMPSSLMEIHENFIVFDNSTSDCYVTICRNCIGLLDNNKGD
jgi:hypothetical protein